MSDNELIDQVKSIIGQSISSIHYTPTSFHYSLDGSVSGNWTDVNPDLFVLHSPQWEFKLSDGRSVYIRAERLNQDNFASRFVLADNPVGPGDAAVLTIPEKFKWRELLRRPIKNFRLWQRLISSSRFLGREYQPKYEESYQIIELALEGHHTLAITTMNGDIGHLTFYPTGYLGEKVGLFIDKAICTSHTVYDSTMRMAITYQSK